jgi:hypothetical protein
MTDARLDETGASVPGADAMQGRVIGPSRARHAMLSSTRSTTICCPNRMMRRTTCWIWHLGSRTRERAVDSLISTAAFSATRLMCATLC